MQVFSVVKSFFTIGYPTKVARRSGVVIQQDGYIASLLAGILVTACYVGIASSRYITFNVDEYFNLCHLQIAYGVFVGSNIVGLLFLICRAKAHRTVDAVHSDADREETWRQRAQTVIPLFGMLIFLLGIVLLDLSMCFSYIACLATTGKCYLRLTGYLGLMYHLLRCMFAICIYLFICIYSSSRYRRFTNPRVVRYLLCLMVACMLFLYYDLESYFIAGAPVDYFDQCNQDPKDFHLLSRDERCTCYISEEFLFAYKIQGFLSPFYVEFFLLATERVLHMFASLGKDDDESLDGKPCSGRKCCRCMYMYINL